MTLHSNGTGAFVTSIAALVAAEQSDGAPVWDLLPLLIGPLSYTHAMRFSLTPLATAACVLATP